MKTNYRNLVAFLWARDYHRTLDFYIKVLGLQLAFEADGWAELGIPGVQGAFVALNRWNRDGRPPTNDFLTLGVPDLDAFREQLAERGVELVGEVWEFDQGMRMFKFRDPEGNTLAAAEVA